jgi:hypothetical protein
MAVEGHRLVQLSNLEGISYTIPVIQTTKNLFCTISPITFERSICSTLAIHLGQGPKKLAAVELAVKLTDGSKKSSDSG